MQSINSISIDSNQFGHSKLKLRASTGKQAQTKARTGHSNWNFDPKPDRWPDWNALRFFSAKTSMRFSLLQSSRLSTEKTRIQLDISKFHPIKRKICSVIISVIFVAVFRHSFEWKWQNMQSYELVFSLSLSLSLFGAPYNCMRRLFAKLLELVSWW